MPVTLEMMILQGRAVVRGSKEALIVVDMPFGTNEDLQGAGVSCRRAYFKGNRLGR